MEYWSIEGPDQYESFLHFPLLHYSPTPNTPSF